MTQNDVTIIGAGPAGCSAAIKLAEAGFHCSIIERSLFPRHRPGESLHPGVQPLIATLGFEKEFLRASFPRFAGINVKWRDTERFEGFGEDDTGPWMGFQAWRADFDQMMLNRAISLGVKILMPCRATGVLQSSERVIGLKTNKGRIKSKILIDAGGGSHWLARQLNIRLNKFSPQLTARYGYQKLKSNNKLDNPTFAYDENGWTWTAKVKNDSCQWMRLRFPNPASQHSGSNIPEHLDSASSRGADVTWRIANQLAGPGFVLVGDAAAVLDPAASHGVLRAIMSGMMSANVVQKILRNPAAERQTLESYGAWFFNWFHHDVEILKSFYSIHSNPLDWILDGDIPPASTQLKTDTLGSIKY